MEISVSRIQTSIESDKMMIELYGDTTEPDLIEVREMFEDRIKLSEETLKLMRGDA